MKKFLLLFTLFISTLVYGQKDSLPPSNKLTKISAKWVEPEKVFVERKQPVVEESKPSNEVENKFLEKLPKSYDNLPQKDLKKISNEIDNQLEVLNKERDELLKKKAKTEVIDSKNSSIKTLKKEKTIVDLTIKSGELKNKAKGLQIERDEFRNFLIIMGAIALILVLIVIALLQRKTIKVQDKELENRLKDIIKKNSFLNFAAKIIRHDMHSGINTYIPRGITSLQKRLTDEQLKELKIDSSIQLIKNGLEHTQKVYKIVYEFTNLVKQNAILDKKEIDLNELIQNYLSKTSYSNQVQIEKLPLINANETLISNAIDNLIRNGLKYNESENKLVKIYTENDLLIIEDNGVGLTNEQLEDFLYSSNQSEESNLGLKISNAIFSQHGYTMSCQKLEVGTKFIIKLELDLNKVLEK